MLEELLHDDAFVRHHAVSLLGGLPEHRRSALSSKLIPMAREEAAALAAADESGREVGVAADRLSRVAVTLAHLRVETARNCLLRIAEDSSYGVKVALVRALRGATTPEARAVFLHLLSDDAVWSDAVDAIGEAPWPGALPSLIELAEADDHIARVAVGAIARCGAEGGEDEAYAAADFLYELLDDNGLVDVTRDALLRHGAAFPGLFDRATTLAARSGKQKEAGLALLALFERDAETHA